MNIKKIKLLKYMLNHYMLYMSHVMEKAVCIVVFHDDSLTSDPPAHMRSRIGVCLLFL